MLSIRKIIVAAAAFVATSAAADADAATELGIYHSPDGLPIIGGLVNICNGWKDTMICTIWSEALNDFGQTYYPDSPDAEACNLGGSWDQFPLATNDKSPLTEDCKTLLDWASSEHFYFDPEIKILNNGDGFLLVAFYGTCGYAYQFEPLIGNELGDKPLYMGNKDLEKHLRYAIDNHSENGRTSSHGYTVCDVHARGRKFIVFNANDGR